MPQIPQDFRTTASNVSSLSIDDEMSYLPTTTPYLIELRELLKTNFPLGHSRPLLHKLLKHFPLRLVPLQHFWVLLHVQQPRHTLQRHLSAALLYLLVRPLHHLQALPLQPALNRSALPDTLNAFTNCTTSIFPSFSKVENINFTSSSDSCSP